MLSIYYLKHIAQKDFLYEREKAVIEAFNLPYKSFADVVLPEFELYAKAYELAYNCLERKFCSMLGNLPHELKGDILILFADRFVDMILNFFRKGCEIIKVYEIKKSGIGHVRCKRNDNHWVSITSVVLNPQGKEKFKHLGDSYKIIEEFKDSIIFHNLEWYKEWAKHLFLISNSFPT